ncbi:glycerate kinase [Niabella insulamsoli]|uniref:glycerate kinase n=1 Tax=Niabella insulamsoli TaxID=3144874 RepID=UPI0031FD0A85
MLFNKKMPHIVIASNAYKNSLSASVAAEAINAGLKKSKLSCTTACVPVGDGGDGTALLLSKYLKAKARYYQTINAIGKSIQAPVYYTKNNTIAIIELADASGLKLLKPDQYAPLHANTRGTGILIKRALNRNVKKLILAIGGSATIDAATGILSALGARFLTKKDTVIEDLPGGLVHLHRIDTTKLHPRVHQTEIIVLCDVKNKLLGSKGAARMFGPQKGASHRDIAQLERILRKVDNVIYQQYGHRISQQPFSGAAGGVAATMTALVKATAMNGIHYFLESIHFGNHLKKADLVITGEGAIDLQTLEGKAPFGVALAAKKKGIPVIAMGGRIDDESRKLKRYFTELISINKKNATLNLALKQTETNLKKAAKKLGDQLVQQFPGPPRPKK